MGESVAQQNSLQRDHLKSKILNLQKYLFSGFFCFFPENFLIQVPETKKRKKKVKLNLRVETVIEKQIKRSNLVY